MSEYNSDSIQELAEDRVYLMKQREFLVDRLRKALMVLDDVEGNGGCCFGPEKHKDDCPVLRFNREMIRWEKQIESL